MEKINFSLLLYVRINIGYGNYEPLFGFPAHILSSHYICDEKSLSPGYSMLPYSLCLDITFGFKFAQIRFLDESK